MSGNRMIQDLRERNRLAAETPAPKPPYPRPGWLKITAFVIAVVAGSVFTALFMIPIQVPVLTPLASSSDVPSFSQVQPYLRPPEGADASQYGLDLADGSSLTADERIACEEAGYKARSAEESATAPGAADVIAGNIPDASMLRYQLRPLELLRIAQLRGQISCYAATRSSRLCAEPERAHLARLAVVFAAQYASGAADVDAIESRKGRLAMMTGKDGPEGETIIGGIVDDFRSRLRLYRRQTLAMLRSVAPWMPADSYAAALGGTVPDSLSALLAEIGGAAPACKPPQP